MGLAGPTAYRPSPGQPTPAARRPDSRPRPPVARTAVHGRPSHQNRSINFSSAFTRLPYGGEIQPRAFRRACVSTGFIFEKFTKPS